jgi:aspartyl-tRNA(Asn)/glutamyl-tRNA(Gln) amidotransferase subunit B
MSVADGYEAVIGLEIHVQLSTRTKMFCGCELSFGDQPNTHTCPVCLAHPGVLPVINEQAVRYALQIALALESEVAPRSIFHRKNYFYPDNPKGYQISQYDIPLARGGRLGDVRIHRVHLEEDAAKLTHVGESGRIHGSATSLVDFNRGGTPLVEIVTEPDLRDPAEAREWAQLLRTTVKQLGVSDVNMEEGSLRCDANVSVRRAGAEQLGTKTELKNMNSFRFLERGIAAELERQTALLDAGGQVEQETFHFDPRTASLTPLRSKEYAHDYRYFPEPDLVPLAPTEEMLRHAREALPELPAERRERYEAELGLPEVTARQLAFDAELGDFFERALAATNPAAPGVGDEEAAGIDVEPGVLANWVTGELSAAQRQFGPDGREVDPAHLVAVARMVVEKRITHASGREVLHTLIDPGSSVGDPEEVVKARQLAAVSDASELEAIVERAIEAEPAAAEKVKAGNPKAIGPIVGAVMRETNGRADGGEIVRLIKARLGVE